MRHTPLIRKVLLCCTSTGGSEVSGVLLRGRRFDRKPQTDVSAQNSDCQVLLVNTLFIYFYVTNSCIF